MAEFRQGAAVRRVLLAVPVTWASCFDVLDLAGPAGDRGPDTSRWGDPASALCDDPHDIGDGRSGVQCWDPPENDCLHGISLDLQRPVARIVLQHHVCMDGSGYPDGVSGDDLLMEACILAVADVVEPMASHRP